MSEPIFAYEPEAQVAYDFHYAKKVQVGENSFPALRVSKSKRVENTFTMFLVSSNEDIVVVVDAYCDTCMESKLEPLRGWKISSSEASSLKTHGCRFVRVKCTPSLH